MNYDTHTHVFTESGLGLAPFRFVDVFDAGKIAGTCDHCGAGIRYFCEIRSADGHVARVGSECVFKTGDAGLVDKVRARRNRIARERRAAKRIEQAEAALQAQRERNGGMTDWELAQAKAEQAEAQRIAAIQPIIDSLEPFAVALDAVEWSDYARDIAAQLRRGEVVSEDYQGRWLDHYSKWACGNRRGSQAYKADHAAFRNALDQARSST